MQYFASDAAWSYSAQVFSEQCRWILTEHSNEFSLYIFQMIFMHANHRRSISQIRETNGCSTVFVRPFSIRILKSERKRPLLVHSIMFVNEFLWVVYFYCKLCHRKLLILSCLHFSFRVNHQYCVIHTFSHTHII